MNLFISRFIQLPLLQLKMIDHGNWEAYKNLWEHKLFEIYCIYIFIASRHVQSLFLLNKLKIGICQMPNSLVLLMKHCRKSVMEAKPWRSRKQGKFLVYLQSPLGRTFCRLVYLKHKGKLISFRSRKPKRKILSGCFQTVCVSFPNPHGVPLSSLALF